MDLQKTLSKSKLLSICKELGITNCNSKNKLQLLELIKRKQSIQPEIKDDSQNETTNSSDIHTEICTEMIEYNKFGNCKFKFIDLFCGIGGFHQALKNINGECVFACDIDIKCRQVYEKNYGLKPEGDITKININEIPSFDVLCGGFPCQPFSKAGFQMGFEDNRGNLFFNICNITQKHNPKYIILENVRNLTSHDGGNTWKVIYDTINKLGYYTYETPIILNVLHFNIPQNRERVIIMCKRKDLGNLPPIPNIPKNCKSMLTKNIKDFVCENTGKYNITGKLKDVENIWNSFIRLLLDNKVNMPKFPIWTDWWDNEFEETELFYIKYKNWIDKNRLFFQENKTILINWLQISRMNSSWIGAVRKFEWQAGELKLNDSMNNTLWSCRGSGIRVKRCDYIPTLVAMSMTPIYGPESRKLSPRELLNLQSFPDSFKFDEKSIYKQVGNSVNVKMIEKCADFLIYGKELL